MPSNDILLPVTLTLTTITLINPKPPPLGASCQRCALPDGHSLCRFDAGSSFPVSFSKSNGKSNGLAAECVTPPKQTLVGFSSVSLSDNGGSDWTDFSDSDGAQSVVNFGEPSVTTGVIYQALPVGLPVYLSGSGFPSHKDDTPGGVAYAPFTCAFDGTMAPVVLDTRGMGLSSTLFRCEVPAVSNGAQTSRTAAVLPPGSKVDGERDDGARASWVSTPWVRALHVSGGGISDMGDNSDSASSASDDTSDTSPSHITPSLIVTEAGGAVFAATLVGDSENLDADARGLNGVGCVFGTTRVSSRTASGSISAECVSPALVPSTKTAFGVGARHAERFEGFGMQNFIFSVASDSSTGAAVDFLSPAIVGRQGSMDISMIIQSTGDKSRHRCSLASVTGGWLYGQPVIQSRFFCDSSFASTPNEAGFRAVRVGETMSGQLLVQEALTVFKVMPSTTASGAGRVNRPSVLTGKDFPGIDDIAWCVGRRGSFGSISDETENQISQTAATFDKARTVSSAVLVCPPLDALETKYGASDSLWRGVVVPGAADDTPSGGAFYAKSSVYVDVERFGVFDDKNNEIVVDGFEENEKIVPQSGGASVFVFANGIPSGCSFGTITSITMRTAASLPAVHTRFPKRLAGNTEGWVICVSPALKPNTFAEITATYESKSWGDFEKMGTVLVRGSGVIDDTISGYYDSNHGHTRHTMMFGHATQVSVASAVPPSANALGGSLAFQTLAGFSASFENNHCVFSIDPHGGHDSEIVFVEAFVVSSSIATCEAPPFYSVDSDNSLKELSSSVAHGGVGFQDGAYQVSGSSETSASVPQADMQTTSVAFSWFLVPVIDTVLPSIGTAHGGVLIAITGTGLKVGTRPAAWFGPTGPVACRKSNAKDSHETVFETIECVSPSLAPSRGRNNAPYPIAASATGDVSTRSSMGSMRDDSYSYGHSGNEFPPVSFTAAVDTNTGVDESSQVSSGIPEIPPPVIRNVVAPFAVPVGGGAVVSLVGDALKGHSFETQGSSFQFALLHDTYRSKTQSATTGSCVAVSSVVVVCESPAFAPTQAARVRLIAMEHLVTDGDGAPSASSKYAPEDSGYPYSGYTNGNIALPVAAPRRVEKVSPSVVTTSGGATVGVTLESITQSKAHLQLGCSFGSVGPVPGRFTGDNADVLHCVTPARAPSFHGGARVTRAAVPVHVTGAGSGSGFVWNDACDEETEGSSVFYVHDGGAHAESSLLTVPSVVSVNTVSEISVIGHGAHFPHFVGRLARDGTNTIDSCEFGGVTGGVTVRATLHQPNSIKAHSSVSCFLPPNAVKPGFVTAWLTLGGGGNAGADTGASRSLSFSFVFAAAPRASALYPTETHARGGGLLWVVGKNLVGGDCDGTGITHGSVVTFGGQTHASSGTTSYQIISSALLRVETPDLRGLDSITGDDGRADVNVVFGGSDSVLAGNPVYGDSSGISLTTHGTTAFNAQRASVLLSRRAPTVFSGSPLVSSPSGGSVVTFAGQNLQSSTGACSVFFGTIGPVTAQCGATNSQCLSPAVGVSKHSKPVYLLAGSLGSSVFATRNGGEVVLVVAVTKAHGVVTDIFVNRKDNGLSLAGWGLDVGVVSGGTDTPSSSLATRLDSGMESTRALCAVLDEGDKQKLSSSTGAVTSASSGHVDCSLSLSAVDAGNAFQMIRVYHADSKSFQSSIIAQFEIIAVPVVGFVNPKNTPALGGGVLWVTGVGLIHSPRPGSGDRSGVDCVVKTGDAFSASSVVSSAIAACEIPPLDLLKRIHGTVDPGDLRIGYALDSGDGSTSTKSDNSFVTPSRGSTTGGTPVRVNTQNSVGWGQARFGSPLGGDFSDQAGCRFGTVSVAARWSTVHEIECVTPSRGANGGNVDVAPVMDYKTRSFVAFGGGSTFKYALF